MKAYHILLCVSIIINILLSSMVVSNLNQQQIEVDMTHRLIDKLSSLHEFSYIDLRNIEYIPDVLSNATLLINYNIYYNNGTNGDCSNISKMLSALYGYKLYYGYAYIGETWNVHIWCVDNNTIIEPTSYVYELYYGMYVGYVSKTS